MTPEFVQRLAAAALFLGYGVWLVRLGDCFGTPRAALGNLACGASPEATRLRDALAGRVRDEAAAGNSGAIAGIASIVLAAAVASGLWAPAAFTIESALIVALLTMRYASFHARGRLRAAVVERRAIARTIPWLLLALAVLASLSIASYASPNATRTVTALGTIVVTLSALVIAIRVANSPSRLAGVDYAAERIVDDRLRSYQSAAMLLNATIPAFYFTAFCDGDGSQVQTASRIVCAFAVASSTFWMVRIGMRRSSASETLSLSR